MLALGITHRWSQAWVEAARPPEEPWHIAAQQILVATLERGEWPVNEMIALLAHCFPELPPDGIRLLVHHMIHEVYLDSAQGLVRIGSRTEREFGRGHYRDLLASFSGAQLLTGRFGSAEVGYIDPTVLISEARPRLLLLAGRSWLVNEIDWGKRTVWLEPAKEGGKARWMGSARSLSQMVCQGIRAALANGAPPAVVLSQRAKIEFAALEEELAISPDAHFMSRLEEGQARTWTFAGTKINRTYARAAGNGGARIKFDALSVQAPVAALQLGLSRDAALPLTGEEQKLLPTRSNSPPLSHPTYFAGLFLREILRYPLPNDQAWRISHRSQSWVMYSRGSSCTS